MRTGKGWLKSPVPLYAWVRDADGFTKAMSMSPFVNAMRQDDGTRGHAQRWLKVLVSATAYGNSHIPVAAVGDAGITDQV